MGIFYIGIVASFVFLFVVNIVWLIVNIIFWGSFGLQALLDGKNFIESIQYSIFLKWIIIGDVIWLLTATIFILKRKNYRTDPNRFYLKKIPLKSKSVCVVIPTYNEELSIGQMVKKFVNHNNVQNVIVVDNNSTDKTVEISKNEGAEVIQNEKNMGFAYSCVVGLKESLKKDTEIVALVEGDGTYLPGDLEKMLPYIEYADMVVGTRELQVLSEKDNQLGILHNWGNYLLAKLIQIKFFSLLHIGSVSLTDVGCLYRIIQKESLKKIIDKFTDEKTNEVIPHYEFPVFMTIEAVKENLRLVEVPLIFKRRIGISKIQTEKKRRAIKIGFIFLWYILKS